MQSEFHGAIQNNESFVVSRVPLGASFIAFPEAGSLIALVSQIPTGIGGAKLT